MFKKCNLKKLELYDQNTYCGFIRYNEEKMQEYFHRPILHENTPKIITKIGKRNYVEEDQFIVQALNDYYTRMNAAPKSEEKNRMLENYNRLYQSWMILNQAKNAGQYKVMEDSYDEISYQLYLLGYKNVEH